MNTLGSLRSVRLHRCYIVIALPLPICFIIIVLCASFNNQEVFKGYQKNVITCDIDNTDTRFRKDPDHGMHVFTTTPKVPNSDDVDNMLNDFFNTLLKI